MNASPPSGLPHIVAVGFRRIHQMFLRLAPEFGDKARVTVLDVGFDQAVARIRALQAQAPVEVVVAAGANGGHLRQHLDLPVVLVKVGGFDVMQALAQAKRLASRVGWVAYEGTAPDLKSFGDVFEIDLLQRSYRTEDEAAAQVGALRDLGVRVVVGPGTVADAADQLGLSGVFLYSKDAVREALDDAVEVARASLIEQAKRERLNTILAHLSDGVISVDQQERIQTMNPAMAAWLGIAPGAWLGRRLSAACPELSLQSTLRWGVEELEKIERVRGKNLIVGRVPIVEQGVLTGAVLTCQDPISIQRVDRHIRTRIQPHARGTRHELDQLLGDSEAMSRVRGMALQCARSRATVLLVGESGTGKELIAQGIHMAGERRDMPFVAVNCAAVSETLLESELFGHEEGAFTGARKGGKVGLFEAAHNGTLFLDEVGEMPLPLQTRLLRVLQEREVLRVGATEPTPVNVRVIAATHRDLQARVAQGLFRLDLYYRLNILRVDVPPLRDRPGDIAPIARALHARILAGMQRPGAGDGQGGDPVAMRDILDVFVELAGRYSWPGNVREVENLLERVTAFASGSSSAAGRRGAMDFLRTAVPELFAGADIASDPDAAAAATPGQAAVAGAASPSRRLKARQTLSEQRAEIQRVLAESDGDKAEAARRLGISRTTLWRKLK